MNQKWLVQSDIHFDLLRLKGDCLLEIGMDHVCSVVKKLYDRGFYRRLHLDGHYIIHDEDWNEIAALPAIETLHLSSIEIQIVLSPLMSSVKELSFSSSSDYENSKELISNLMYIERVIVEWSFCDDILPFIRHAARVKEIRIYNLEEGSYFEDDVIDVAALNRERERLIGACKQTIYVKEKIILATIWAGMPTRSNLVQLKRAEAIEWKY